MSTENRQRLESDAIPEVNFLQFQKTDATLNIHNVSEFKLKELNGELLPEPLLTTDKTRFVLFPIKQTDVRLKI
jgi:hypothetical protein